MLWPPGDREGVPIASVRCRVHCRDVSQPRLCRERRFRGGWDYPSPLPSFSRARAHRCLCTSASVRRGRDGSCRYGWGARVSQEDGIRVGVQLRSSGNHLVAGGEDSVAVIVSFFSRQAGESWDESETRGGLLESSSPCFQRHFQQ